MDNNNPCATAEVLRILPSLNGHIGIAGTDASSFRVKLARAMRADRPELLKDTLPFLIANSRGTIAVPEIAIHSIFRRDQICIELDRRVENSFRSNTMRRKRNSYAFYPLICASDQGIVSFKTFLQYDIIDMGQFWTIDEDNMAAKRPLYNYLREFVEAALSPEGYSLDGEQIYMTIDVRTGFYCIGGSLTYSPNSSTVVTDIYKVSPKISIPFSYSADSKKYIRAHMTRNLENLTAYFRQYRLMHEKNLEEFFQIMRGAYGINGTPYLFHKGDHTKYRTQYHLQEVAGNNRRKVKGDSTKKRGKKAGLRYTRRTTDRPRGGLRITPLAFVKAEDKLPATR